jgi:hypothetical protein
MSNSGNPIDTLRLALEVQQLLSDFNREQALEAMATAHNWVEQKKAETNGAGKSDCAFWLRSDIEASFASLESSFKKQEYTTNTGKVEFLFSFLEIAEATGNVRSENNGEE